MMPYYFQIPLGAILAIVDPVIIAVSNWMSTIILGTFRNNWEAVRLFQTNSIFL